MSARKPQIAEKTLLERVYRDSHPFVRAYLDFWPEDMKVIAFLGPIGIGKTLTQLAKSIGYIQRYGKIQYDETGKPYKECDIIQIRESRSATQDTLVKSLETLATGLGQSSIAYSKSANIVDKVFFSFYAEVSVKGVKQEILHRINYWLYGAAKRGSEDAFRGTNVDAIFYSEIANLPDQAYKTSFLRARGATPANVPGGNVTKNMIFLEGQIPPPDGYFFEKICKGYKVEDLNKEKTMKHGLITKKKLIVDEEDENENRTSYLFLAPPVVDANHQWNPHCIQTHSSSKEYYKTILATAPTKAKIDYELRGLPMSFHAGQHAYGDNYKEDEVFSDAAVFDPRYPINIAMDQDKFAAAIFYQVNDIGQMVIFEAHTPTGPEDYYTKAWNMVTKLRKDYQGAKIGHCCIDPAARPGTDIYGPRSIVDSFNDAFFQLGCPIMLEVLDNNYNHRGPRIDAVQRQLRFIALTDGRKVPGLLINSGLTVVQQLLAEYVYESPLKPDEHMTPEKQYKNVYVKPPKKQSVCDCLEYACQVVQNHKLEQRIFGTVQDGEEFRRNRTNRIMNDDSYMGRITRKNFRKQVSQTSRVRTRTNISNFGVDDINRALEIKGFG